jgi:hypothetical protein
VIRGPPVAAYAGARPAVDTWKESAGMGETIPFTSNYSDVSTYDGYQFEFYCRRCGNGHRSSFRPAVTSMGGKIAEIGGTLLGGEWGSKLQQVGMFAQYGRSGTRGVTNDQRLEEAAEDVADQFHQCRGCAEWMCVQVCWNEPAGLCHQCAAARQQADPSGARGFVMGGAAGGVGCPSCGAVGSGKFCGDCGTALIRSVSCRSCGAETHGARFCGECGTPTG